MKLSKDYFLNLPSDYEQIISREEYWESIEFDPIILIIEESSFNGEDVISHQLHFEIFEDETDGYRWALILTNSIVGQYPQMKNRIFSDSESETCVLWVKKLSEYEILFDATMKILTAMNRI